MGEKGARLVQKSVNRGPRFHSFLVAPKGGLCTSSKKRGGTRVAKHFNEKIGDDPRSLKFEERRGRGGKRLEQVPRKQRTQRGSEGGSEMTAKRTGATHLVFSEDKGENLSSPQKKERRGGW